MSGGLEPPPRAFDLPRRLAAEAFGAGMLVAIVIGSGIMGERLAGGNDAIALLSNTVATGAGLVVLITVLGPISGAHLNPAVTLVFAARREIGAAAAAAYLAAQLAGSLLGVWTTHLMFDEVVFQVSATSRDGPAQAFSEGVATFGLIVAILGALRFRPAATPTIVGLYITAAYWFTASTSFANPSVTVARSFSDTFAGIAPASALAFILAQLAGAAVATALCGWLFQQKGARSREADAIFGHGPVLPPLPPEEWIACIDPDDRERLRSALADLSPDLPERENGGAQPRQAPNMESVGQFTGDLAHDFNNLLSVILGNLDFIEHALPERSPALEFSQTAMSAALKGAELTQQLLAFSRRQPLAPQAFALLLENLNRRASVKTKGRAYVPDTCD